MNYLLTALLIDRVAYLPSTVVQFGNLGSKLFTMEGSGHKPLDCLKFR